MVTPQSGQDESPLRPESMLLQIETRQHGRT
jgi:hypothetical protein